MNKLLKQNVLLALDGLPPDEYLWYCNTDDQAEYWYMVKLGYQYLKESFGCYFSGEADPSYEGIDYLFWGNIRDWYLSLYGLLQRGWLEIEAEYPDRRDILDRYARSPGEAFIRILEDDCAGVFSICLEPIYRESPYQERVWSTLQRQFLTEPNLKKRSTIEKKLKKIVRERITPAIIHHSKNRFIFLEILQRSKNELVRSNLIEFKRKTSELDRYITHLNHPNQGRRGGVWNRGTYRQN